MQYCTIVWPTSQQANTKHCSLRPQQASTHYTMVLRRTFIRIAMSILKNSSGRIDSKNRDFRALFGISPQVCVDTWHRCNFSADITPKHLMWTLMFLKTYATEPVLASLAGVSRKTYRKWVWRVIPQMSGATSKVVGCRPV